MNYDKCISCKICETICPKQAIKVKLSFGGFLYPIIDNTKCINCKLCEKNCPANNIISNNIINSYIAKNNNINDRLQSSSGGIFKILADIVIKQNGVVFGAKFDENFNVYIGKTYNNIIPMLGAKYVAADIKNSYKECELELKNGRLVLYSGTPCQIYGLKSYLKQNYDNLITVDIFCHGVPSPIAWQTYLKSFNKEIESINFRDKRENWEQYHLTIKFKDGTEFSENHNQNKYMKQFLSNETLRKSCFDCKMRSNQVSDISIGDAWGFESDELNDHNGLSNIIIHNEKILSLLSNYITFKKVNNEKTKQNINLNFKIPANRYNILKMYTPIEEKDYKIAICTHQVYKNIGGILQAVSLYDKIKELYPLAQIEFINQANNGHLKYFDNNIKWVTNYADNRYTHLITGSDQIWNPYGVAHVKFEDAYLIHNDIKHKIAYAASFGNHDFKYTQDQINKITNSLKDLKYISVRENIGTMLTKKWFNKDSIAVLDPTMLYDKDYYLNKINEKEIINESEFFTYILDPNIEWRNQIEIIKQKMNINRNFCDGSVEDFLHQFNKCKFVITDSYHGCVFSLIFNKPFICKRNVARGNDRFDDLIIRFPQIEKRFIYKFSEINYELLNERPNVYDNILQMREPSIKFLKDAIKD